MEDLIKKLSKITWAEINDNRTGLVSQDKDWKVFYYVDIDQSEHSDSRFCVTIYVTYKEASVTSYGCNLAEQNMFAEWFLNKTYKIRDKQYEMKQINSLIGKKSF